MGETVASNGHSATNGIQHGHSTMRPAQEQLQSQTKLSPERANRLADFYKGKNILITGATGFIGKVCLVKLVKALPVCGNVYVLLRSKRGMSPQQRFNKLLADEPFSCVSSYTELNSDKNKLAKTVQNLDWSKVVAIEGDMSSVDLGFSPEVKEMVCGGVDIVFNIAASVQFDAPLKQNLRDNYLGCRNLLHLASQMEKLISLVHVSTFYTNCHLSHIEEKVLPMDRDCEKMADLISWMPDKLCDKVAPEIMENRPNTYIFTKAMAENLVMRYEGKLPIAIVRPSIVTPSVKEPVPGWVDNVNGPMGLGILASLGILRTIDWNYWGVADVIPVDTVVNSMLAVAERTPRLGDKEIKVYNCSSSSLNPLTWGEMFESLRAESIKAPPYKMLRLPIHPPKHRRANRVTFALTKMSELLFAYFIDFILMICGQKQILTKLTHKLHHGYDILLPFTTNEFTCANDNLTAAYEELQDEDKKEFDFDIAKIDQEENFKYSYYGSRCRLLKEDLSNVPAALFKMRIQVVMEFIFKLMFYALIAWTSYALYGYFSRQLVQLSV